MRLPARLAVGVLGLVTAGCRSMPAPVLPAGIAELQLPHGSTALTRIAQVENASGALDGRRDVIANVSRQLLSPPPSDVLVPELFDLLSAMAPRMESRAISPAWASYIFTSYERDLQEERPAGTPRRTASQVEDALQGYVDYFRLQVSAGGRTRTLEDAALEDTMSWRTERRIGR